MSAEHTLAIVRLQTAQHAAALKIARALPQWFTVGGVRQLQADLEQHSGFVALFDKEPRGFLTWTPDADALRLSWMGVHPAHHRQGIGRHLVLSLAEEACRRGIKRVLVDTLGDSVDYPPYAATRRFYRALGFRDHQRTFQPDNPECKENLTLLLRLPWTD